MVKSMTYAGFWIRFLAYIIDGAILSLASGLLFGNRCEGTGICIGFYNFETIIPLAYMLGFWIWKGATPGKMICKLQIVDEKGNTPTPKSAVLRLLGYFLSFIVFAIGFISIGFDSKKQGWHDKIAKTYVIKVK